MHGSWDWGRLGGSRVGWRANLEGSFVGYRPDGFGSGDVLNFVLNGRAVGACLGTDADHGGLS